MDENSNFVTAMLWRPEGRRKESRASKNTMEKESVTSKDKMDKESGGSKDKMEKERGASKNKMEDSGKRKE